MFGPKLYTVHFDPDTPPPDGDTVFIREGFNIFALLFMPFWALYHRLWLVAAILILLQGTFIGLADAEIISQLSKAILSFILQLLFGFHANDFWRAKLQRRGYMMADITTGESLLRAEQRFFERYLAVS